MIKPNSFFTYKVFVFIVSSIILFSSCTKEEEETSPNDNTIITGEWKCNDSESENGIYGAQSFTIDISKNTNNYTISNFGNLGINAEVTAQISGSSITVSEQTIDDITTHGTGTFTNNSETVNFTYYLDNEKIKSVWNKN